MKNRNLIVISKMLMMLISFTCLTREWGLSSYNLRQMVTYDELRQFYFRDWIRHVRSHLFTVSWYLLVRLVHDIKTENLQLKYALADTVYSSKFFLKLTFRILNIDGIREQLIQKHFWSVIDTLCSPIWFLNGFILYLLQRERDDLS
jgi:hypothetical protein